LNRLDRHACQSGKRQLVEVFGEPRRGLGEVDKAVLDHRGLGVHAHRLVAGRLIARHAVAAVFDQILDQLGARGLVLNQHDARIEQFLLLAHCAPERRIFEPPAEYIEEEEVLDPKGSNPAARIAFTEMTAVGAFQPIMPGSCFGRSCPMNEPALAGGRACHGP
jgi:hypothetical protein